MFAVRACVGFKYAICAGTNRFVLPVPLTNVFYTSCCECSVSSSCCFYFRVGCSAKRTASRSRVPGACNAAETGSGGRMLPERVGRVVKQLRIKRRRGIRAGPGNDRQRDGNRRHGMPRCPTARHLCNCSSTSLQCMSRAANAIQLKQTTTLWTS